MLSRLADVRSLVLKKGFVMNVNELKDLNEKELNRTLWDAIETRYGYLIEIIRDEMNRRVREA